ncbi:membrane-bound lytic murein transglycosylase F [Striga asiatica]|uniref:Membrane-bound lytic murein transglycosylase F n=1 Tax=Striga asiatica TaxID=4170 RepID=A0A5A7PVE0_STRAF|nr:membrane-bound lytic murein transglycosylase F [Striga asiatica]
MDIMNDNLQEGQFGDWIKAPVTFTSSQNSQTTWAGTNGENIESIIHNSDGSVARSTEDGEKGEDNRESVDVRENASGIDKQIPKSKKMVREHSKEKNTGDMEIEVVGERHSQRII